MRAVNTFGIVLLLLPLVGCQQAADAKTDRVAPTPLVEQIDPEKDPVKAVRANKEMQLMTAPTDIAGLRAEVMRLTRDKSADNIQQCLVLPLGHKPCGGPSEYIAVSLKGRDEGTLLKKISAYNQAVEAENIRRGMMSDCAVVPKPAVQLVNGQCQLVSEVTH